MSKEMRDKVEECKISVISALKENLREAEENDIVALFVCISRCDENGNIIDSRYGIAGDVAASKNLILSSHDISSGLKGGDGIGEYFDGAPKLEEEK